MKSLNFTNIGMRGWILSLNTVYGIIDAAEITLISFLKIYIKLGKKNLLQKIRFPNERKVCNPVLLHSKINL